jgi:hypothetical protein
VFGAQARFRKAGVTVVGEATQYTRVGDEGSHIVFNFCPKCGATVHFSITGYDEDNITIPVGAFADPAFPEPTFSVYEERQHSWVGLPQNIEHMF